MSADSLSVCKGVCRQFGVSARVSADSLSVCEGVCRHYDVRSRRQSADTMVGISQTLKTVNAYRCQIVGGNGIPEYLKYFFSV